MILVLTDPVVHLSSMCWPYISPHEGSTEQKSGKDGEPLRSSELYPPELPCWQDQ